MTEHTPLRMTTGLWTTYIRARQGKHKLRSLDGYDAIRHLMNWRRFPRSNAIVLNMESINMALTLKEENELKEGT